MIKIFQFYTFVRLHRTKQLCHKNALECNSHSTETDAVFRADMWQRVGRTNRRRDTFPHISAVFFSSSVEEAKPPAYTFTRHCIWNFHTEEDAENWYKILTLKGQFECKCHYLLLSNVCFSICNKEYDCIWKPLPSAYIRRFEMKGRYLYNIYIIKWGSDTRQELVRIFHVFRVIQ